MVNQYLCFEQEQQESVPVKRERDSKIKYNFRRSHPLLRFVTEQTVAFLFNIEIEQIYRIECWQHVVYVHGEGVSRFVSYSDFPPIITAAKPNPKDFVYWCKRWVKVSKRRKAPKFWTKFYTQKFIEARSREKLREWGNLIAICKFCFEEAEIKSLRKSYVFQQKIL